MNNNFWAWCVVMCGGCFLWVGCVGEPTPIKQNTLGPYMGMTPTQTPTLLWPEALASSLQEYNGTFNPEGNIFFYTINTPSQGIIAYAEMQVDSSWSAPRVAPFSGTYSEYDPLFSPDGKRLYFSSERPLTSDSTNGQTHIWFVERSEEGWTKPQWVDLHQGGTYYSSLTHTGALYFNRWDTGDMYKATAQDTGYQVKELPAVINSPNGEGDPFISPEEDYLIFRGYNQSLGNGDLYISFRIDDSWTEPENLGEPINSQYHEMCPYVTADKQFFIFASSRISRPYVSEKGAELDALKQKHQGYDNGELNIFYISADFIQVKRAAHLDGE